MNRIMKKCRAVWLNPWLTILTHGLLAGIMLALIFLRLYHSDFSTAPEFIYNQF